MGTGGLSYGLEHRPPLQIQFLVGLQHVAVLTIVGMAVPMLIAQRAGVDAAGRESLLAMSMIAMAAATLLLCRRPGRLGIGTGFLAPAITTTVYLPASLEAADKGGLPLVFGMTIFAGVCVVLLSRVIHRLRPWLPTEISGIAVTIIGIVLGGLGFRLIFETPATPPPAGAAEMSPSLLGIVVVVVIVWLTVWGGARGRMLATLIGFGAGCAVAAALGMLVLPDWVFDVHGWARAPRPFQTWPTFDPALIPDFLAAAVACSLRAMGDIAACERINDPAWKRQNMRTVQGGMLAAGIGTVFAGMLGTVGVNTSSVSVGVTGGSGVTSRRLSVAIAILLVLMALAPRPRAFLVAVPLEVSGGVLLFSACFIVVNGFQILMSRMLDARKTIMIGLSLVLGIGYGLYPHIFAGLPPVLHGLFGSDLVVAIVTAILLNLLFRIGTARRVRFRLGPGTEAALPYEEMEARGREWGARPEVIARVANALAAFHEHADLLLAPKAERGGGGESGGEAEVEVRFDEYAIDVDIRWTGTAPPLPADGPPDPDAYLTLSPAAVEARLRLLLLARLADRVRPEQRGTHAVLRLHFEH